MRIASGLPRSSLNDNDSLPMNDNNYLRIASEEAFVTAEILDGYRELLREGSHGDPGFADLWGHFMKPGPVVRRLLDLDAERIHDMDQTGIARQILLLTAPGVQIFDA